MEVQKLRPFPLNIIIVGAGGVGSYLLPTLLRTVRNHAAPEKSPNVILYDGDKLEKRNMERQLFDDSDVGRFKCEALAEKYRSYYPTIKYVAEFFTGQEALVAGTIIFVCVDNHPGRMRVMNACNIHNCDAILCGNGYTDAEAMYYKPAWKDTPLDPLVYYPDIRTVQGGDPLSPAGCTGHAQQASPQLAIANFMAAAYALHLFWFWTQEGHKLEDDFKKFSPVRHVNNFARVTSSNVDEFKLAAVGSQR